MIFPVFPLLPLLFAVPQSTSSRNQFISFAFDSPNCYPYLTPHPISLFVLYAVARLVGWSVAASPTVGAGANGVGGGSGSVSGSSNAMQVVPHYLSLMGSRRTSAEDFLSLLQVICTSL